MNRCRLTKISRSIAGCEQSKTDPTTMAAVIAGSTGIGHMVVPTGYRFEIRTRSPVLNIASSPIAFAIVQALPADQTGHELPGTHSALGAQAILDQDGPLDRTAR